MSSYFKAVELKGLHIYPSTTNNTTNVSRNYHPIAGMQSSRSLQKNNQFLAFLLFQLSKENVFEIWEAT